ncbi:MAG: AbrB/MazE/SpoVT family DNA-binding domain-containing protein [Chloroflexi bacterium]|nr:AbrB/MazE/SpoVT family DNA-binding domain-containing protein [Chloroflexota bacterium]MBI4505629.1 AbrB/MazE/SpoVT family DNA-binding domain-containing protein [Chloroflexota bacterium]
MKEVLSSVSPKGQVTLPVEIRRALGIKPKDKVAFRLERGKVEITTVPSPLQESYQAIPALEPPRSWQEIEALVAEERAQDAAREGLK